MEKQKNYQRTFDLAVEEFISRDISYLNDHPGIQLEHRNDETLINLPFFQRPYTISYPAMLYTCPKEKIISLVSKIIILHYLLNARQPAKTGKLINYGKVPGASFYFPVFKRKTTDILINKLGNDGPAFKAAGTALNATPYDLGDVAFTLKALPDIDLIMVFWEGDEDFPPSYDILFDAAIDHYLSLEDIVVLAQMATKRVLARALSSSNNR